MDVLYLVMVNQSGNCGRKSWK